MKIAIVVSTFPPYRGGMGNVAEQEARLFTERGHDVTVFFPLNHPKLSLEIGETPYKTHFLKPLVRYGNAAVVPGLWGTLHDFDVVYLHYPFFGGAEFVMLRKLLRHDIRYVLRYHMDVVGLGLKGMIFRWHAKWLMPTIMRGASKILVSSRDYAETSLLKRFYKDIESRIEEAPFPVPRLPGATASRPGKYFLMVGGLDRAHYFKGVDILLRAFATAKTQLPEYRLTILGEGDLKPGYQALAAQLRIEGRVDFLGNVPRGEEMSNWYAGARALVFPSVDRSEAFGLVLLEALSFGAPVIASDLPGVRTVATDEVGLRVPVKDSTALAKALITLATDDSLRASFSVNALRAAKEKYGEQRSTEKLEAILQSVRDKM